ncbi:hypothetical protein Tco_1507397 [Tanacetum coccineum]
MNMPMKMESGYIMQNHASLEECSQEEQSQRGWEKMQKEIQLYKPHLFHLMNKLQYKGKNKDRFGGNEETSKKMKKTMLKTCQFASKFSVPEE